MYSYARVDLKKSGIEGPKTDRYCSLCEPFGIIKNKINGIYIDDTNWGGEDIFHLHEMGGSVYISQKFLDFYQDNGFTNLQYINSKEYKTWYKY